MDFLGGLLSNVIGFLGASAISALTLFNVAGTTTAVIVEPESAPDEIVMETDAIEHYVDFSAFGTSAIKTEALTTEMLVLSQPEPAELMQALVDSQTLPIEARFSGLLAHVRWLINQDGRVEAVSNGGGVPRELFDKQIESTADDINDSINSSVEGLEDDISDLDSRLLTAETTLAGISLAAASTSVMASNLTLNGHWLSGDGADEGVFVDAGGNVGVGTSTPLADLAVVGDLFATGAFRDSSNNAGTAGMVLRSNGVGTEWVATSSLGITGGGSAFTTSAELAALLSDEVGTSGGFLRASSSMLTSPNIIGATLSGTISNGTFSGGTWQGNAISSTYLDSAVILSSEIDTSSELITLVTDETGTGALVFANSPTLTGTLAGANATLSGTFGVAGTSTLATTTASTLTIAGALRDSSASAGTAGMVLQTTGSGTQWVATSSLGITSGATTFLALTDTPSSYTANRIMYTNSGATALIDNADLTYNGTNLGLGGSNGIAFGGIRIITASTTNDSLIFGENAGATFNDQTTFNVAIGYLAGRYASTTGSDYNNFIGYQAGYNNTGTNNNLFGYQAGYGNTGSNVVAIGYQALGTTTAGNTVAGTVGIGYQALLNNTTGSYNTAVGSYALAGNVTGYTNSAFGRRSLVNNITGAENSAFGEQALEENTIGSGNSAFGNSALEDNFDSSNNSAFGIYALSGNTTGNNNSAFGTNAGRYLNDGVTIASTTDNSVYFGYGTRAFTNNDQNAIVIGYNANGIGSNSVVLGNDSITTTALKGNVGIGTTTPGSKLTVAGDIFATGAFRDSTNASGTIGMVLQTTGSGTQWVATSSLGITGGSGVTTFLALTDTLSSYTANRIMYTNSGATALTDSSNFVFDGTNLGVGTSTPNNFIQVYDLIDFDNTETRTRIGYQAGKNLVTGALNNTFIGYRAGYASTTGSTNFADSNTGIGSQVLFNNASGNGNTVAGNLSMHSNVSGSANVASGNLTLYSNLTGDNNTALGYSSLYSNTTGGSNTAVGHQAMYLQTTGNNNTAVGRESLYSNTSGGINVALGNQALYANSSGFFNAATGYQALYSNTDGVSNTAFGYQAGRYLINGSSDASTTDYSVYLGAETKALTANDQNTIVIGYNANGIGSNSVVLGNDSITTTALKGNVGIGTTTPGSKLTVAGDIFATGAFRDSTNASGTVGMVLQTTGTSTRWVATSTLGFASGASTFLGLSDTPGSFSANRIMFTNSGATALTDSVDFTYDGTNLGLGGTNGIAFGGTRYITASTTNDSITFGENAGATFSSSTLYQVAIGFEAGRYASTSASNNTMIGYQAGLNNTASNNNLFGVSAGANNTGLNNNFLGGFAGYNNAGSQNNFIGTFAGRDFTDVSGSNNNFIGNSAGRSSSGSYNNLFGENAGRNNAGSYNNMFGYRAGYYSAGSYNILLGAESMFGSGAASTSRSNNVAIGYRTGYNATTGADNNILIGHGTAENLTSGASNIIIGYDVDIASTTGNNQLNIGNLIFGTSIDGTGTTLSTGNIGIGVTTPGNKLTVAGDINISDTDVGYKIGNNTVLYASSTNYSTLVGIEAGNSMLSDGQHNTANGFQALYTATSSDYNTANGYRSLYANTTGYENTANGATALNNNTDGLRNTATGYASLLFNTTGSQNTANGAYSLFWNTAGDSNTAIGVSSLGSNTDGNYNTANGFQAGSYLTDGISDASTTDNSIFLGSNTKALTADDQNTIVIGYNANGLGSNTVVLGNDSIVTTALKGNVGIGTTTAGSKLTVEGDLRLYGGINFGGGRSVYQDAGSNLMVGEYALFYNDDPDVYSNTAVGITAGNNLRFGFSNTFMGFGAGTSVATGSRSVILGNQAVGGSFGTADLGEVVVIGDGAGYDLASGGSFSTFVGYRAGENVTDGGGNTLIGWRAGDNITTGYNNIVIGQDIETVSAGAFETLNIGNLIFGTDVDGTGTTTSNGNIGIGTSTPESKLTVAGTIQSTTLLGGSTNLTTDAAGNIIRDPSDARLKENVVTIENALDTVLALRGVRYEWIDKDRFGDQFEIGFIAQEVDEVVPEVVQKGGEYWSLNSKNLIAVVVEAMKEMWATVGGHEERLIDLEAENSELKARLEAVEAELGTENNNDSTPTPEPQPEPAPEEENNETGEIVIDEPEVPNVTEPQPEPEEEIVIDIPVETEPAPEVDEGG